MIDGIRRKLGRPISSDPWDADLALQEAPQEREVTIDTSVLLTDKPQMGEFAPDDENTHDFFKTLVATAIENGGRVGGHQISVAWLRMIQAGLEMRPIEPEMMWTGVETDRLSRYHAPGTSSYDDLFPDEKRAPGQLGTA